MLIILAVLAILTGSITAKNATVSRDLYYGDIKIRLNGNLITPKDALGNIVEPFAIDGTTYLPIRAISGALGLNVDWDGATATVILDSPKTEKLTPAQLYETCKNSVVHIETGISGGTGFFIDEDIIVTNNHVIEGAWGMTAKTADGQIMKVTHILARSHNPDLAILKVDGKGTPVTIASATEPVGANAYSIGAPLGIFPTFSSGMIQNNTFTENDVSFYLTNIGTISGNSGGPVFNDRGEVIGVVQGGMTDGSNTIDMMIRIDHINDLDMSNPEELTGKEPLPEDEMTKADSLKNAEVGQLVSFGHYEQDNDPATTNEDILWVVLENNGKELKLMSLYCLDVIPMMITDDPMSWEGSYARAFLNDEFLKNAFSASEQAKLKTVTVENKPNPLHGTPNGDNTLDRVYLPSLDEIMEMYDIPEAKEQGYANLFAHATEYTQSKGVWLEIPGSSKCWWWLRSSGGSESNAAEVGSGGYLSFNGTDADGDPLGGGRAIRPIIHVSVE